MAWAENKFISIGWENVTETALYVVITAWDDAADNGKIAEGTASGGDPIAPWTLKAIADANWALCKVPLAAEGGSFIQMGSFPELPAGDYALYVFLQAGLTPDKTADTFQRLAGIMPWDGEKPVGLARSMAKIATVADLLTTSINAPAPGTVGEALALIWAQFCAHKAYSDHIDYFDPNGDLIHAPNLLPPGGPFNERTP